MFSVTGAYIRYPMRLTEDGLPRTTIYPIHHEADHSRVVRNLWIITVLNSKARLPLDDEYREHLGIVIEHHVSFVA